MVRTTYADLAKRFVEEVDSWKYHMWVRQLAAYLQKLDKATFDGRTAIEIITDFGNRNKLRGVNEATCEISPACGCVVAIVLYNPKSQGAGEERSVETDVWRFFSSAKDNADHHAMLMEEIYLHYKGIYPHASSRLGQRDRGNFRVDPLTPPENAVGRDYSRGAVPELESLHIFSDGKKSTYKGAPCLGVMMELSMMYNVEIRQFYGAAHHMSSSVDTYGAQPVKRCTVDQFAGKLDEGVFDPYTLLKYCNEHLAVPEWRNEGKQAPTGTYACNGAHIFGGFNDEGCLIPERMNLGWDDVPIGGRRTYKAFEGTSMVYGWRIRKGTNTVEYSFMPCRCASCRLREINPLATAPCQCEDLCGRINRTTILDKTTPKQESAYTAKVTAAIQARSSRGSHGFCFQPTPAPPTPAPALPRQNPPPVARGGRPQDRPDESPAEEAEAANPEDDEEADICCVCGGDTIDNKGDPMPNVVCCSGCDNECHCVCMDQASWVANGHWFHKSLSPPHGFYLLPRPRTFLTPADLQKEDAYIMMLAYGGCWQMGRIVDYTPKGRKYNHTVMWNNNPPLRQQIKLEAYHESGKPARAGAWTYMKIKPDAGGEQAHNLLFPKADEPWHCPCCKERDRTRRTPGGPQRNLEFES